MDLRRDVEELAARLETFKSLERQYEHFIDCAAKASSEGLKHKAEQLKEDAIDTRKEHDRLVVRTFGHAPLEEIVEFWLQHNQEK